MYVNVKILENVGLVHVSGNLMGGPETSALHDKVRDLIRDDITDILLDMSGVRWVNSVGLGVLLGCYTSLKQVTGRLKIANPSEKLIQILNITQLTPFFSIYDNVETALIGFQYKNTIPPHTARNNTIHLNMI